MAPAELARIVEQEPGEPVVRRTEIPVRRILELMAQGVSDDEILSRLPGLEREDLRTCVAYAERGPGSRAPELEQLIARRFPPDGREQRVGRALAALDRLRVPFSLKEDQWREISEIDLYEE